MKEVLFSLSNAVFVGTNQTAKDVAINYLKPLCDDINTDLTGSVIATINGQSEEVILLQAHIDEIGFTVTKVLDGGFLRVEKVGGIDVRTLPASKIKIYGKQTISGIFCSTPPHLEKGDKNSFSGISEMLVDTGLENLSDIVQVGDFCSYSGTVTELQNDFVTGKSFDDRAGCAILIDVVRRIKESGKVPKKTVVVALTSGEELGNRGAKIAAFGINASQAIAIDVSFARSHFDSGKGCGECGEGGMIGVSPVLSKEVTNKLIETAEENDIKFQYEVMGGRTSTDADVISIDKTGVACGLVSIPLKYMHTPVEVLSLSDLDAIADLLFNYVKDGGIEC